MSIIRRRNLCKNEDRNFCHRGSPQIPISGSTWEQFWGWNMLQIWPSRASNIQIFLGEDPQTPLSKSETLFKNVFDMPPRSSNIQNFLGEDLQTPLKIRKVIWDVLKMPPWETLAMIQMPPRASNIVLFLHLSAYTKIFARAFGARD